MTAAPTRTETYAPTRMTEAPSYAPTPDTYAPTQSPTATEAPTPENVWDGWAFNCSPRD